MNREENAPVYSASWYRVATLKPRLRSHAGIHRQQYRGQWDYVLEDPCTQRFYRLSANAYALVGLMDGKRNVEEIWEAVSERLGEAAPTQDETIQLVAQLHSAALLQCDVLPDPRSFRKREEERKRKKVLEYVLSPLFWRLPVLDPEPLLRRLTAFVRPAFTRTAFAIWVAVSVLGVGLAAFHFTDLTENVADRVLGWNNLLLLWLVFLGLKALHELAHAFAVKKFGGEVHELGVMFLLLVPLPYIDASAASGFRSKWQKVLVSSAGVMVEIFVASLALIAWLGVGHGVLHTVLYNVIFVASVSTVLFNANPLLRFDGYYVLADILEIPNLRKRAAEYLGYLVERYAFGNANRQFAGSSRGERCWLLGYALASFAYRIFLLSMIVLFIAGKYFFVGVGLALWGFLSWFVYPLCRATGYVAGSPRLRPVRRRAVAVTGAACAVVVAILCLLPLPMSTFVQGVVCVADDAVVRAGVEGFIVRLEALPGSRVERGDSLVICADPVLEATIRRAEAEVAEFEARYDAVRTTDTVEAKLYEKELEYRRDLLSEEMERRERLRLRSPASGVFVVEQPEDLPGRFVEKGEVVGLVVDPTSTVARVVVPQERVDLVRHRTTGVTLRHSENLGDVIPVSFLRETPAAREELPSSALGAQGGGEIPTDPHDLCGVKSIQTLFQFDLKMPRLSTLPRIGGRVFVRFDHGHEPLAWRWYRSLRQLFLARFHV